MRATSTITKTHKMNVTDITRAGAVSGTKYIAMRRHNERIGCSLQLLVHKVLVILFIGPLLHLALRVLFRLELQGEKILDSIGDKAIFVSRHFYEWDPFLSFSALIWPRSALGKHHFVAQSLASGLWTTTPLLRAVSWTFSVMSFIRGHEPHAGAIERASRLLKGSRPTTIAIYPTGPIGTKKTYNIHPGVAHLALSCPDVPIVPINVKGLAEVSWRDLLAFKRPRLTISVGHPFTAKEVLAGDQTAKAFAICERINKEWNRYEATHETTIACFERRPLDKVSELLRRYNNEYCDENCSDA